MKRIYHITSRGAWDGAKRLGRYEAASLGAEGFIHCSTAPQLVRTANRYFRGETGLVVLEIEESRLRSPVKYEGLAPDLFPHVYGPLPLDAVVWAYPYAAAANGEFGDPEFLAHRVRFLPMTQAEFEAYRRESIREYMEQKMRAESLSRDDAEKIARESFRTFLPDGLETKGCFLYSVISESTGEKLGSVWFGIRGAEEYRRIYLYEIILLPEARSRGYGRQIMLLIEEETRRLGLREIGLHVFGHNARARALYESLGYVAASITMRKRLG